MKSISRKQLIKSFIGILVLITAVLGYFQYLYIKTTVYHCKDQRKNINILIKKSGTGLFSKSGYLELQIIETDGKVYVLNGAIGNYSIFNTSFLYIPKKGNPSEEYPSMYGGSWNKIISLDTEALSFSVSTLEDKPLYSGLCSPVN